MKYKHLLVSLLAAGFAFAGCNDEEKDLGLPEVTISEQTLSLEQARSTATITVNASRDWNFSTSADWIYVSPSSGKAYKETTVTLTILQNDGYNRSAGVKFDIGYDSKTLTVNQAGPLGEKTEGTGTATDPYTVKGVLAFIATLGTAESESEVYVKGKINTVTDYFSANTYGNATFTIADNATDAEVFTCYRVKYLGNKAWAQGSNDIAIGDEVIICGKVVNYGGKTPETVSNSAYVYSHNGNTGSGSDDQEDDEDAIFSESFASSQGEFTITNITLPTELTAIWTFDSKYTCMKATAYANSTNYESESWLISPAIDLGNETSAFLSFSHAGNYFEDGKAAQQATVHISIDGGATWTAVDGINYFSNFNFVNSGEIDLSSYIGKTINIGFCYKSTASKAGTWEIKNVKVYRTGAEEVTGTEIALNNSLNWTVETDETYKAGLKTSVSGFTIAAYQHQGSTAIDLAGNFLQADHIRVFKNSAFAVTAPEGKTIKTIVITPAGDNYLKGATILEGDGTYTVGSTTMKWAGSASKVVLATTDAQIRISKITVDVE